MGIYAKLMGLDTLDEPGTEQAALPTQPSVRLS